MHDHMPNSRGAKWTHVSDFLHWIKGKNGSYMNEDSKSEKNNNKSKNEYQSCKV